ncbi:MAG: sulfotransferase family protein [Planctomycetota bacterium]
MDTNIDRPVFLVGTGRCGSTMLYSLLGQHPDLAFTTGFLAHWPDRPAWHRLALRTVDCPVVGPWLQSRLLHGEPWTYWNHHVPGFAEPMRDMRGSDLTVSARKGVERALAEIPAGRRQRVFVKFTGWTRVELIGEVCPDARVVHVVRNPRAVANSLLAQPWWCGWRGPTAWRWGELSAGERRTWEKHDRGFEVLAAIQWKKIVEAFQQSLQREPSLREHVTSVRYDRLCDDLPGTIGQILAFCQLRHDAQFTRAVEQFAVRSGEDKWRSNLNEQQQQRLTSAIAELELDRLWQDDEALGVTPRGKVR